MLAVLLPQGRAATVATVEDRPTEVEGLAIHVAGASRRVGAPLPRLLFRVRRSGGQWRIRIRIRIRIRRRRRTSPPRFNGNAHFDGAGGLAATAAAAPRRRGRRADGPRRQRRVTPTIADRDGRIHLQLSIRPGRANVAPAPSAVCSGLGLGCEVNWN